jgi:hypothetical protein
LCKIKEDQSRRFRKIILWVNLAAHPSFLKSRDRIINLKKTSFIKQSKIFKFFQNFRKHKILKTRLRGIGWTQVSVTEELKEEVMILSLGKNKRQILHFQV